MSDTPDLDKALADAEALLSSYPTRKQIADAFLEQRADEAEYWENKFYGGLKTGRAADLRRQAGGGK